MVYFLNLIAVPLYYLLIRLKTTDKKSAVALFSIIVSIHAVVFRALANPYNYEEDTVLYADAFRSIRDMSFFDTVFSIHSYTHWGQLYLALNWLLGLFSSNPAILFVVVSVISVGLTIWFYKQTSYTILTSILLYLMYPMMYIMGFGVLRQHLSIAVVLLALLFWDRLKLFVFFLICASLLHPSSLIIFPFLVLRKLDLQRFKLSVLIVYSVIAFIVLRVLILLALPFFSKYQEIFNSGEASNNIVPVMLIGSMILMYYVTGAVKRIDVERDMFFYSFLVYGLIVSVFSIGVPGAGRLSLVFIYMLPVAISHIYKYGDSRMLNIIHLYTLGVFLLTIVLIVFQLKSANSSYNTYSFFWNVPIV